MLRARLNDNRFALEREALCGKILASASRSAHESSSDLMLVHLGSGPEITEQKGPFEPCAAENLMAAAAQQSGTAFVTTREAFIGSGHVWSGGHYMAAEARLVAREVYNAIAALTSWRRHIEK